MGRGNVNAEENASAMRWEWLCNWGQNNPSLSVTSNWSQGDKLGTSTSYTTHCDSRSLQMRPLLRVAWQAQAYEGRRRSPRQPIISPEMWGLSLIQGHWCDQQNEQTNTSIQSRQSRKKWKMKESSCKSGAHFLAICFCLPCWTGKYQKKSLMGPCYQHWGFFSPTVNCHRLATK